MVIPAYAEEHIDKALQSLHATLEPNGHVAIIIIINEPENADTNISSINEHCHKLALSANTKYPQHVAYIQLPSKKAGVGLARKIGMDEAVRCFENHNKDGVIVCYDADCTCSPNYLQAIENFFYNPTHNLGMIHYEHDLEGKNAEAIVLYELFLRYYTNALRVIGYPNALQTLGSCITVKSKAYQKQGGMNTRKAGEDFYFIHKMVPLGGLGEINEAAVYPSDRTSERVPFGTGFAINNYKNDPNSAYPTYSYHVFEDLASINHDINELYQSQKAPSYPDSIKEFYAQNDFSLSNLIEQSGSFENFRNRYYSWWDGFKILKYVHFCRDKNYHNQPLSQGLDWLDDRLQLGIKELLPKDQLMVLRNFDRQNPFYIK